jgi:hypothetical protein
MAERSARRPRRVPVVDAPSARAASLASSAASLTGLRRSGFLDPLAFPPATPLAFPPPPMAGATHPRSAASVLVRSPSWGQSAAVFAADWPPSGEWCSRAARSASRD